MIGDVFLLAGLAGVAWFTVDVVLRESRRRPPSSPPRPPAVGARWHQPGGVPVSSLCDRRRSAVRVLRVEDDDRVAG